MKSNKTEFTGYELSRDWFDFAFENPDLIKPVHAALYFFIIEHNNRMGWSPKFGLPTMMAMSAIGVKNWRTYKGTFDDLEKWGFIKVYELSKNQYSATVIGLVKNTKAHTGAYTKAQQKHIQKHRQKQSKSIVDINKHINHITNKPINNPEPEKKFLPVAYQLQDFSEKFFHEKFLDEGSLDVFDKLIRLDGYSAEDIQRAILFARGDDFWTKNFLSPKKLRKKNPEGVLYIDVFLAQTVKTNEGIKRSDRGASLADLAEIVQREFGDYPVR